MRQVVIGQFALFQQRVDLRQAGLWTITLQLPRGNIETWGQPAICAGYLGMLKMAIR
jgi:hypothetical protein